MGCVSSKAISVNDNHIRNMIPSPPDPKEENIKTDVGPLGTQRSKKIFDECTDDKCDNTITTSVSLSTSANDNDTEKQIVEINKTIDELKRRQSFGRNNSPDDLPIDKNEDYHLSWTKRRNSEKQKTYFMNYKRDIAHGELQKRISLRSAVHSKCPTCGDLGPETSDQYYTFYLIVPSVITKTKCRRCNVYFSFEYMGAVKSIEQAIGLIMDEDI